MQGCHGRARFQQHRDASCHQVLLSYEARQPKEIHVILTEILAGFLPRRAKDLSAPLYKIELSLVPKEESFSKGLCLQLNFLMSNIIWLSKAKRLLFPTECISVLYDSQR